VVQRRQPLERSKHAAYNIAGASVFSSDGTIRAYAREIWGIVLVKAELSRTEPPLLSAMPQT
jgi:hypothetical protein